MSGKHPVCVDIEADLIAAATGEAGAAAAERVAAHVAACGPCRTDFAQYRAVNREVGALRGTGAADAGAEAARVRLLARLADIRSRLVRYAVIDSPLGPILVACSEQGVVLLDYLGREGVAGTLERLRDVEVEEDPAALARLRGELLEYLAGRRRELAWPLDWRLARSDFQRAVLHATAAVPYGAVASYAAIAGEVGDRRAVRAVAQVLRHHPLPIVVPCHRIIGSGGHLTGYAGNRVGLKERLLAVEGVQTEHTLEPRVARRALYHYEPNEAREYCLPTCGSIARRPIVLLFTSREQAEARGLVPCATCRPDVHPLVR
jgi:methylated-DNA-[protein]-cysteine S-methyltransferase